MKKILTTIGIASVVAFSSHAQGLVVFSSSTQNISTNNLSGVITTQAAASGKTLGAGNFYYALFYSTTPISSSAISGNTTGYAWQTAGWTLDTDATASSASTGTAGRFGATAANADGSTTVPGVAAGSAAYFVIVGWSANLGTTLAQAEQALTTPGDFGYIGQSATTGALVAGNGGLDPNPNLFGGASPQTQAFTLGAFFVPVPEPGTLALAALGGASLLLFRRKK
jgi:hypothetical protein